MTIRSLVIKSGLVSMLVVAGCNAALADKVCKKNADCKEFGKNYVCHTDPDNQADPNKYCFTRGK